MDEKKPRVYGLHIICKLDDDADGEVWKVLRLKDNSIFTLKTISYNFRKTIVCQTIYRQIRVLQQLDHPNIVKLHSINNAPTSATANHNNHNNIQNINLLFDPMENTLESILSKHELNELQIQYIFVQICNAIQYLHSREIVHGDLRLKNVMVNGDCKCKVGGFGRVRSMRWGRVEVDGRNEDGDGDGDDEDCGRNGNRRRSCWAPEILLGLEYGYKVDVWSLGCMLGEMVLLEPMFEGGLGEQLGKIGEYVGGKLSDRRYINNDKNGGKTLRKRLAKLDPLAADLINGMLKFNPKDRLTIEEIMKHPYVVECPFKDEIVFKRPVSSVVIEYDLVKVAPVYYRKLIDQIVVSYGNAEKQSMELEETEECVPFVAYVKRNRQERAKTYKKNAKQVKSADSLPNIKNILNTQQSIKKILRKQECQEREIDNTKRKEPVFRDAVNNINPHKIINFTSVEKHYTCKDNGNNNNMQKGNRMTSYDKSFNTPYKHIVHNNNINFGRPPTNIQYFHKQLSSDRNLHIYKLTSLTSLWECHSISNSISSHDNFNEEYGIQYGGLTSAHIVNTTVGEEKQSLPTETSRNYSKQMIPELETFDERFCQVGRVSEKRGTIISTRERAVTDCQIDSQRRVSMEFLNAVCYRK